MKPHPSQSQGGHVSPGAVPADPFKLERYKFILQQLNALNDNLHKYLALFQTLATAIIAAGATIFVTWKKLEIGADVASSAIQWLLVLLGLLGTFVVISIVMGMCSWHDYRSEEKALLDAEVGAKFRRAPKVANLWRWYETYALVFVIVLTVVIIAAAQQLVVAKIV